MIEEFQHTVRSAAAARQPLQILGGGTKAWYGQDRAGQILDTRAHTGVIDYDPAELVLRARCGTPLADIEALLAGRGQMLPFEPPHFGAGATLGGCIASGLAGPRRMAVGAVRDLVLGATLLNGSGDVLEFGGQVMKNVAGYDVARMLAGSLGTLGLILDVSLKVLPQPFAEATLRFEASEAQGIEWVNAWSAQPLPLSASAWHRVDGHGLLSVRLSGAEASVRSACRHLGGALLDGPPASAFWRDLREQTAPFFAPTWQGAALWRIAVPGTTAPLPLPGAQLIEWTGAQRWWLTDAPAQEIRHIAAQAGGHATLFRNGDKTGGVFTPLDGALRAVHRRLKTSFDPAGIFNPGRLYPDR